MHWKRNLLHSQSQQFLIFWSPSQSNLSQSLWLALVWQLTTVKKQFSLILGLRTGFGLFGSVKWIEIKFWLEYSRFLDSGTYIFHVWKRWKVLKLVYRVSCKKKIYYSIDLSSVHLIVGQNFRIQFYVVQNEDLHQKSYWQSFFDTTFTQLTEAL